MFDRVLKRFWNITRCISIKIRHNASMYHRLYFIAGFYFFTKWYKQNVKSNFPGSYILRGSENESVLKLLCSQSSVTNMSCSWSKLKLENLDWLARSNEHFRTCTFFLHMCLKILLESRKIQMVAMTLKKLSAHFRY